MSTASIYYTSINEFEFTNINKSMESKVSLGPKMDLIQDDSLASEFNIFPETILSKTSSQNSKKDPIQDLQAQSYKYALQKKFKKALKWAEKMPVDSMARTIALSRIAENASCPDKNNKPGDFKPLKKLL